MDACSGDFKPSLTVTEALSRMMSAIAPLTETETVNIKNAVGRVSAKALVSPINIPFERNAAMDGYALRACDIQAHPFQLDIIGTAWAGKPFDDELPAGQCVRIMTGAVVPRHADTVVMQELVRVEGTVGHFPGNLQQGQNIREAGEDVRQNALLLPPGKKLSAEDLALLAAAGIAEVQVIRQPRVIHFSTGDELVPVSEPLANGKIYDSNRFLLHALLADHACQVVDGGILPDKRQVLEESLAKAAQEYDAIITTGGASVGEADYIKEILAKLGRVEFWKIAIKPGKPMAFGRIGGCYFFGLPGNPVAVAVTFRQLVAPVLKKLSGTPVTPALRLTATCTTVLKKSPGREEFQRGVLTQEADGSLKVCSAGKQGSHILSSLSAANCFIILPADCKGVATGDSVVVEPFGLLS